MSNKKDLLQSSIADAKLLKEVAMLNAKKAIEESFAPHLKSMLSTKIQEMEDEEQLEEAAEAQNELMDTLSPYGTEEEIQMYLEKIKDDPDYASGDIDMIEDFKYFIQDKMDSAITDDNLEEVEEEEFDLEEVLKEISEEEIPSNPTDPNDNLVCEEEEEEKEEDENEEGEDEDGEEDDEEIDLDNLSEEGLRDFIENVINDMIESGELEADEDEEGDEDLDIDIEGEDEDEDMGSEHIEELMETKHKLDESLKTISKLKNQLNETKLLNSKLLYVNKIYKSKVLTEDKKVRVLEAFNNASTIKEVKMTYDLLKENIGSTTKNQNNSFKGFASKPVVIKENKANSPILEDDELFLRMKKLAGLI